MIRAVTLGMWVALAGLAAGCTMNAPPTRAEAGGQALLPPAAQGGAAIAVQNVTVHVPPSLTVSEANTIKPAADIVWHGDAAGDRYEQVAQIMRSALHKGVAGLRKGTPVVLDVTVLRFHAITPRTRQSIGGKHELIYALDIRDAATGAVLAHIPRINATVRAAGGAQALAEEAAGLTQKVVISQAVAASIGKALHDPRLLPPNLVAQRAGNPSRAKLP